MLKKLQKLLFFHNFLNFVENQFPLLCGWSEGFSLPLFFKTYFLRNLTSRLNLINKIDQFSIKFIEIFLAEAFRVPVQKSLISWGFALFFPFTPESWRQKLKGFRTITLKTTPEPRGRKRERSPIDRRSRPLV